MFTSFNFAKSANSLVVVKSQRKISHVLRELILKISTLFSSFLVNMFIDNSFLLIAYCYSIFLKQSNLSLFDENSIFLLKILNPFGNRKNNSETIRFIDLK